MPKKTFVTGTVLTAADVNEFLMNQTVMVFASASARNTAITSPTEGMIAYLSDTNTLTIYDGAAWVSAVNTASIQNNAVTPAKLQSGMHGVSFADLAINTGTTYAWYMVTIPAGKQFSDVVSIIPYGGVNDIVYMYALALGNWSGVQGPTQAQILCHLGNGVASSFSTVRFYFRSV